MGEGVNDLTAPARARFGQPSEARALRSLDTIPHNLPGQVTSFVGRTEELTELAEVLAKVKLVTLTGGGGCGKSRLALQVAADSLGRFPDGAWWVELAPISDPALVALALAQVVGVRPLPGQTELDAAVAYLAGRRAVVLLDNCEHLLEESARVAEALALGCDHVRVLATSREPLRVAGEVSWRVPSLSLPDERAASDTTGSDAVKLFVERATMVRPGFALDDDNAGAIVRICRELDGIPLGIELAAARLRVLSVVQMADGLADRFRLFNGGAGAALSRHQTLRASVDWSHELLEEPEQVMFRRLGVFMGGFTLEGVEQVCTEVGIERAQVLDLLAALVDKSLVQAEERRQVMRFGLLETMRQYALERLVEAGEEEKTRDRHRDFYLELAERTESELLTPGALKALDLLDPEAANFAQAIDRAVDTEPGKALRLCAALTFWWRLRGHIAQAETGFSRALQAAGNEPSAERARALWGRAFLLTIAGDFGAAIPAAHEALVEAERVRDDSTLAAVLCVIGAFMIYPDPAGARVPLERGRELAASRGDDFWLMRITQLLAYTHLQQGDFVRTVMLLDEVRPIAERLGHHESLAWHWNAVAAAAMIAADLDAAREAAGRALAAARAVDDVVTETIVTIGLAIIDLDDGNHEAASERFVLVRERTLTRGASYMLPWLDINAAYINAAAGRLEDSLSAFQSGIDAVAGAISGAEAWGRVGLAEVLRLQGEAEDARTAARTGLEVADGINNRWFGVHARLVLGRLAAASGEWEEAQKLHHDALSAIIECNYRRELPRAFEALAEVAAGLESYAEAARILGAAARARADLDLAAWKHHRDEVASLRARIRQALGYKAFADAFVEGETLTLEEAVAYVRRARGKRRRPAVGWESLTPTEQKVVRHATAGLTNPEIAERMFVSRGTIKTHLSSIYSKLSIKNRAELAAEATRRTHQRPA